MVKSFLFVNCSFLLESISTHSVRKDLEEVIINLWFCINQERWLIWNSFPYTGLEIQIYVYITLVIIKTDFVTSSNLSRIFPWKFRKLQHYVEWVKFATFLLFIFREWVQSFYFTFLFKFLLENEVLALKCYISYEKLSHFLYQLDLLLFFVFTSWTFHLFLLV